MWVCCYGGGYWFKQRDVWMFFDQYLSKLTNIRCTSQVDKYWFRLPDIKTSPRIILQHTLWAFLLSALWFCKYIRLKLDTMTGTGKAITRTPLREHKLPTIFPGVVFGTMSPYLKQKINTKIFPQSLAVCAEECKYPQLLNGTLSSSIWIIHNTSYFNLYDCKSVFFFAKKDSWICFYEA